MKRVAVISPNPWDAEEIEKRSNRDTAFIPVGPGIQQESPGPIAVAKFLFCFDIGSEIRKITRRCAELNVDGVLGTDEYLAAPRVNERMRGVSATMRSHQQVTRFFHGLKLIDPGVVPLSQWRRGDWHDVPAAAPGQVLGYCGIARKPPADQG